MNLVKEQSAFTNDIASLEKYAIGLGWMVTLGEAWRPEEMQAIYVKQGKSKTMKNSHGKRLAQDLNFFKPTGTGHVLTYAKKDLQIFGDFWEQLNPKNTWGGNWPKFLDTPHFERRLT